MVANVSGLASPHTYMSDQALPIAVSEIETVTPGAAAPPLRFATRVAGTFGTRLVMVAAGIGSSIVAARWLGSKGFGELSVVNVTGALALQIGSAGLPSAIVYFVGKDRRHLATAASNALLCAIVIGSALGLSVIVLSLIKPALFGYVPAKLLAVGAVSIPFLMITLLGLNLLLAIDRVALFNVLDAAAPLLVLLNTLVALVVIRSGVFALVSFNTAAAILISLATIAVIVRSAQPKWQPSLSLFKRMTTYAIKFYISIIGGVIIIRADLLIVNHFRGASEAGVYAVASQVATLMMLLPGVVATLLFPRVASSEDKRAGFTVEVTRHTSLLLAIICVVTVPIAFALPVIYGPAFADGTIQLLILLPGVYFISIESVMVQHFTGTGLPAMIPAFWLLTLVLSLTLNLIFVPGYGARAAAAISTLSYTLIFVLVAVYFRAKTGNRLSTVFVPRRSDLHNLLRVARFNVFSN